MRHTSLPPRLDADLDDHLDYEHQVEYDGEDIQMHSDGEQPFGEITLPASPPPRIAARINKSRTLSSRRSSASSSRRNSLSSLQSGRSNRSCHGGPFSTHVAQHLRRASILDARRARLAERAAHVEQVRLRAQAVKAAPRSSRSPEERAQAAREAREKHLAQVAAAGAEEVKRAKRVAEDTKERREREEERMRAEMEEKHANAERRRLLYERQREQRRRRNSSDTRMGGLPAVQETRVKVPTWKPKNRDVAAKVVQRAWREYRLRKAVADFVALELDVEHVQAASFEHATERLMHDGISSATRDFMRAAHLLHPSDGHATSSSSSSSAAAAATAERVRNFLSAYLVLCHPQQVLSKHGRQEEDLINRAKILLMEVQHLLTKPRRLSSFCPTSEFMLSLRKAHDDYQAALGTWKAGDATDMAETMVLQFVELDAIMRSVMNDTAGGVADDYSQGIKQNQAAILVRLKRLVGPQQALQMLRNAIGKRRREDAVGKKAPKHKPRGAAAAAAAATIAAASTGAQRAGTMPVLQQSRARADPERTREPVFSPRDLAQVVAPLPDNRTLVHELALDREWRMDAEKTREARQAIRRATFQTIREDLITGKADYWILNMVEAIRGKLLRTVPKGGSMYRMLTENLDTDLIEKQLFSGTFSHERFFGYMASVLPKLVSPARDADVRDFARDDAGADFTERLEKLFRIIDYLSLDYANFMLQQSAPKLVQSAHSYEIDCFEDEYGPGTVKLPLAKAWWRAARQTAVNDMARRPPSPPSSSSASSMTPPPTPPRGSPLPAHGSAVAVRPTAERIYTTGLVDLFVGLPGPNLADEVPENLRLDLTRISEARATIQRIIATSTVLLTAKNALKRDVRTPWRNAAQRMWDISTQAEEQAAISGTGASVDVESVATGYLAAVESAQALPPAVKASLSSTIRRVLGETYGSASAAADAATASSSRMSHPVLRVLLTKLRANVLGRVLGGEEERRRKEGTATEALSTAGMVEHVERVRSVVDTLQRVKRVDWDAHKSWLNKIREEVDEEEIVTVAR